MCKWKTLLRGAAPAAVALLLAAGLALAQNARSTGVMLTRLLPGEQLARPVHLAEVPDGSGRLAVVEQAGRIKTFAPKARKTSGILLDIQDKVSRNGNEEGLLSVAFAPRFRENRIFYVYYSAAGPRRSIVARFVAGKQGLRADPGSERIILTVPQPYSNHNGGQLAFGPDGMLYIGLGDGGSAGDPMGNGQDRTTLLGSILRIDVSDGPAPYRIPRDNPFVAANDGSRGEIWAFGLRNPWRFSFDRKDGRLYAGDVGQNTMEEVNRIVKGGNYGWNDMEGTLCFHSGVWCDPKQYTGPLTEYTHEYGVSITGGFVYRGSALPALAGRYLFGDFGSGTIWSIPLAGDHLRRPEPLLQTAVSISSFGEDAAGELYVLDLRGAVYKLVPGP